MTQSAAVQEFAPPRTRPGPRLDGHHPGQRFAQHAAGRLTLLDVIAANERRAVSQLADNPAKVAQAKADLDAEWPSSASSSR